MSKPIRVAVVGLGWAVRSIWLPRLLSHPGYAVTALVDPDQQARAAVADVGAPAFADAADLTDVDLAVVAVPNHLHARMAAALLARGINVFVEKPVCLSSEEALTLTGAERTHQGTLLAGSAARYRHDVQRLYTEVTKVGAVRHIEVSWVRARGVPGMGGWFTDRSRAGGGALLDLGWHLLDVTGPLIGEAPFTEAVATTSDDFLYSGEDRAAWRQETVRSGRRDVEDTARGFLVTDDGISIALRASWASHERFDATSIRVDGHAGTVNLRCTFGFSPNREGPSALTVTSQGETEQLPLAQEPIGAEYDRQLDQILLQLADPASKGRAMAEATRTIRVIERLYESARRSASLRTASASAR